MIARVSLLLMLTTLSSVSVQAQPDRDAGRDKIEQVADILARAIPPQV